MKTAILKISQRLKYLLPVIAVTTMGLQAGADELFKMDPSQKPQKTEKWRRFVVRPDSGPAFIRLKPGEMTERRVKKTPTLGKDNMSMVAVIRVTGSEGNLFLFSYFYTLGITGKDGRVAPYALLSAKNKKRPGPVHLYAKPAKDFKLETDKWLHIAAIFDREGDITLYVNGEMVASLPIDGYSDQDIFSELKTDFIPFTFRSITSRKDKQTFDLKVDIAYAELSNHLLSSYMVKKDYRERLLKEMAEPTDPEKTIGI